MMETHAILLTIVFASSLVNKCAVAVSRQDCKKYPNTLWDTTFKRCVRCLQCPPGTRYTGTFPCGYGEPGEKGSCPQCDIGEFQSEDGNHAQCTACTQCSSLNRVVTHNCSREIGYSFDSTCGECLPEHVSLSSAKNSSCVPCADVPGCQTDEPTIATINASMTSSDYVPLSIDFATEATTTMTDYWWTLGLAAIVGIIIIAPVCVVWRKRNRSPSATSVVPSEKQDEDFEEVVDVESGVFNITTGRPNRRAVQKHADGFENFNMEKVPFIGLNLGDGVNASRSSSGYISQGDELQCWFTRDAKLRRRYDQAIEILSDKRCNKPVMECNFNILLQLSTELNPHSTGTQNWKHLGSHLEVPNQTLENYEREEDPLLSVLKFTNVRDALKLDEFLPKLRKVENYKALEIITMYVLELEKKFRPQEGQNEHSLDKDTTDIVGYVLEHEEKLCSHEGQNEQLLDKDTTEAETIF